MNFATRLKEVRKKRGLTQLELANALGVGLATVAMWESARRQTPAKMLIKIADFFKVTVDYLLGTSNISDDIIKLPVLAGVAAGFDRAVNEFESGEYQEIPLSLLKNRKPDDMLVLKVEGDSMSPKFLDGDHVLVQKQDSVESGDIAIVCYEDFENGTIKKVHFETGCGFVDLIPLNPNFKPVRVQDEQLDGMRIIGKVIYLFRQI